MMGLPNIYEVYHLPYYDYYEWAIDKLRSRNIDCSEVLILTSHEHRSASANQQSCRKYVKALAEFLNDMGVQTQSHCGTTLEDFSTMFYAPGLIGGASSYSFSAGIGRISEGTFCCPMLGLEEKGCFYSLSNIPSWMYDKKPLLHDELRKRELTYHDVDDVEQLLRRSA